MSHFIGLLAIVVLILMILVKEIKCGTVTEYGYLGNNVTLHCGIPIVGKLIQLRWYKENGQTITLFDVYKGKNSPKVPRCGINKTNLIIHDVILEDESLYRCSVTDANGIKEKLITLKVLDKRNGTMWLDTTYYSPDNTRLPQDQTPNLVPGSIIHIEAVAYSFRGLAAIKWTKGGQPIGKQPQVTIEDNAAMENGARFRRSLSLKRRLSGNILIEETAILRRRRRRRGVAVLAYKTYRSRLSLKLGLADDGSQISARVVGLDNQTWTMRRVNVKVTNQDSSSDAQKFPSSLRSTTTLQSVKMAPVEQDGRSVSDRFITYVFITNFLLMIFVIIIIVLMLVLYYNLRHKLRVLQKEKHSLLNTKDKSEHQLLSV